MNALRPGTKVLFDRDGHPTIGIVREPATVPGYIIDAADGPWFAQVDQTVPLPANAPMLRHGDLARVRPDAPRCANQYGTIADPELQGRTFGYWLNLNGDQFWIPAEALIPLTLAGNGGQP